MGFNPSSIASFLTADKSQFQTSSFQTIIPRFGWKKGYPINHRIVLWAHCPIIYMTTMANLLQSTTFPQHFPWLLHHLVNLSSLCGFTHGLALAPVAACYGSEITDDPLAAYGFHPEMVMFHEIHQKSHEKWGFSFRNGFSSTIHQQIHSNGDFFSWKTWWICMICCGFAVEFFTQRPWWFEWDLGTIKWSDLSGFWSFGAQRVSKVQVVKEGLVTLVLHKSRWWKNCWLQPENSKNLQPEPIEHPENKRFTWWGRRAKCGQRGPCLAGNTQCGQSAVCIVRTV